MSKKIVIENCYDGASQHHCNLHNYCPYHHDVINRMDLLTTQIHPDCPLSDNIDVGEVTDKQINDKFPTWVDLGKDMTNNNRMKQEGAKWMRDRIAGKEGKIKHLRTIYILSLILMSGFLMIPMCIKMPIIHANYCFSVAVIYSVFAIGAELKRLILRLLT